MDQSNKKELFKKLLSIRCLEKEDHTTINNICTQD